MTAASVVTGEQLTRSEPLPLGVGPTSPCPSLSIRARQNSVGGKCQRKNCPKLSLNEET